MYDCKLMELGERSLWSGWAAGRSFFVVEGGGRMADDGRRGDGCRLAPGFVGGWLLGCRNSAKTVFKKSELAACCRSDSGLLKNNADFRQPRISSPPAEAEPASILSLGCAFRPERRKEASRGTEAGAMAPCPGCGEFLKAYRD